MKARRIGLAASAVVGLGSAGLALPAAYAAAPATIYVDSDTTKCHDSNSGLTPDAPLCTVAAAMASPSLVPGGTVTLTGMLGAVDVTRSGTPGFPITIEAWNLRAGWITVSGQHDLRIVHDSAVSDQTGTGGFHDVIHVVNSDHIVLDHSAGDWATQDSIHLTNTRDSVVNGGGFGWRTHAQILIDGGSTGNRVQNVEVDYATKPVVTIVDSPGNAVINNSIADASAVPIAVSGASTGTTIENNIIYNTWNRTPAPPSIASVTVDSAATSGTKLGYNIFDSSADNPDVVWGGVAYPTAAAFDQTGSGRLGHDLDADPAFAGVPENNSFDLTLRADSPAIDAGDGSVAPALDGSGATRIADPAVAVKGGGTPNYTDIGASEFHASPFVAQLDAYSGSSPSDYQTVTVTPYTYGGWWPSGHESLTVSIDGGPAVARPIFLQYTVTLPEGKHTFTLNATDAGGETTSTTTQVTVQRVTYTPHLTATDESNGWVSLGLDQNAGAFTIDMGDGTTVNGTGTCTNGYCGGWASQYQYKKPGTYTLKLTGVNQQGWPGSATAQVTVTIPVAPTTPGPQNATLHRVAGDDRFATAVATSRTQWTDGSAGAVVLASGLAFPDALAGVPLAAHVHGPLLVTDPKSLDQATVAEIKRVLGSSGKTVYVLGGDAAVSPAVLAQLPASVRVQRIGGNDRFDTSRRIANVIGASAAVVVASGVNFPDALTAGPLAAKQNAAIVLSDGASLDSATAAFVAAHHDITAVGGPAAAAVRAGVPLAGRNFTDLHGDDRYATAHLVFKAYNAEHSPTGIDIASGASFPDALTGGAYAANAGHPLALADPALNDSAAYHFGGFAEDVIVNTVEPSIPLTVFGGPNAISNQVFGLIAQWTRARIF